MSSRITNCPNCGGEVQFKAGSSLLSVCPYCSSAVARTGDDITELEILGQVAPLADIGSPLSVGVSGRFGSRRFTIVGRVQLDYGLGPWNEWYAAFEDGTTWGWIAEAQGRVYLTFEEPASGLPSYAEARVGSQFMAGEHLLTVVERRRARFVAAEGELPFAAAPGSYVYYCDVEGAEGVFGTLDYGGSAAPSPEALFLGRQLEYTDLFDKSILKDVTPGRAADAVGLNCPNCGAAVELRAPDESQRVTCGTCDSFLDCSRTDGNELFLLSAAQRGGPEPLIPLGGQGEFNGRKWTVFGHLTRSVTYEGIRYQWEEYLLRDEQRGGYRWLIFNDGHWTWTEPVHAGDVSGTGRMAAFKGQTFKHYQSSTAQVDHLRGEFYWKVEVGERVGMMDFIRPPEMLSRETAADEINWSLGTYVDRAEIESAFKLKEPLPAAQGVAPHQPNPHGPGLQQMGRLGLAFTIGLVVLAAIMNILADNALVYSQTFYLPTSSPGAARKAIVTGETVKEKFTVDGWGNIAISVNSDVNNTWLFLSGKLINESTSSTRDYGVQVSLYSGYSGGESWSNGSRRRTVYLGSMSPGDYTLIVRPEWSGVGKPPSRFGIAVYSQVFMLSHAILFAFLLWILPLIQGIRYLVFEKQRWAESDHV